MTIYPSIDLRGGQVVRLKQGDFDTTVKVADDPLVVARDYIRCGAKWLHCVDLDGARDGARKNGAIVRELCSLGLSVQLGGGLRTMADLEAVEKLGVSRFVIGSAAVSNPEFVADAIKAYGADKIAVGVDSRDGFVRTDGWEKASTFGIFNFVSAMLQLGVETFIYTDTATDGTLAGPPLETLTGLRGDFRIKRLIASGGIGSIEDVRALAAINVDGAIIGSAYYYGKLDLKEAIELVS
ncbi:MAG: 1-(5-phosphoribosyl)-5-[(5-phosphoribosylamino)methylideneamino]imidazole-4-carboxamide isomerase [Oscillospiraceae bacterium]|jgi:phosphoribosylformimino-5-aminoimidazole carboxamide ribotide isomerase|nr:1-(5-phosphoribosyl)-5-[(5-phosphoribosylamino)methylideneamino]imidazole-4-carboxamide isomerase [Oscillospiraceae bacterium]